MSPAASGPTRRPKPTTLGEWLDGPPRRSQRELAKLAGCHQSHISMLLRKERVPSARLARKLQQVTGLSLDVLIPPVLDDDDADDQ